MLKERILKSYIYEFVFAVVTECRTEVRVLDYMVVVLRRDDSGQQPGGQRGVALVLRHDVGP